MEGIKKAGLHSGDVAKLISTIFSEQMSVHAVISSVMTLLPTIRFILNYILVILLNTVGIAMDLFIVVREFVVVYQSHVL